MNLYLIEVIRLQILITHKNPYLIWILGENALTDIENVTLKK
jgi:hypothetical protein